MHKGQGMGQFSHTISGYWLIYHFQTDRFRCVWYGGRGGCEGTWVFWSVVRVG